MIDGGLRTIFRQHLPRFDWQSIESGLTGEGIPDSNYCCDGFEGWVEFKKTDTNKITFRPGQVGWHLRRARAGGRTFIAVRYRHGGGPRKGTPTDTLYLFRGIFAKRLAIDGLGAEVSKLEFGGGPSKWDWEAVGWYLRS